LRCVAERRRVAEQRDLARSEAEPWPRAEVAPQPGREPAHGELAGVAAPRQGDAADREVVDQFVARVRRQIAAEAAEAAAADAPG
jgi:hypothetical protein